MTTRIGDLFPFEMQLAMGTDPRGLWYSIGEHRVAPYVDMAGPDVNFVPYFRARNPKPNHGENRAWLVVDYAIWEGSPLCSARPSSNHVPRPGEIRITNHAGYHTDAECATCWFLTKDRYSLIAGALVPVPVTFLGHSSLQCREPRFDDVLRRLRGVLATLARRRPGRREDRAFPTGPRLAGDDARPRPSRAAVHREALH